MSALQDVDFGAFAESLRKITQQERVWSILE
jgi:hypothetical protein